MRFIESRWLAGIRPLYAALLLVTMAPSTVGASRPSYGGTLRVELRGTSVTLDPREWKSGTLDSATGEKLRVLVFDRLVALDNYGRFQPQLATEWSHDAAFKRWQFALRGGVKFSDGSALTTADVVAALQPLLPGTQQIQVSGNSVVIQSNTPAPDLLGGAGLRTLFCVSDAAGWYAAGDGTIFCVGVEREFESSGKAGGCGAAVS
jgi:ABC-type transport system substrate-binding protein